MKVMLCDHCGHHYEKQTMMVLKDDKFSGHRITFGQGLARVKDFCPHCVSYARRTNGALPVLPPDDPEDFRKRLQTRGAIKR